MTAQAIPIAPPAKVRWHDLDALRAGAMLLGILLHALLAHIPTLNGLWPVNDSQQSSAAGWLLAGIHGFRMQLFFILSGFFTAMLWRQRGLKSLLWHRFRRIFLPLLIGVFTIIPAVWGAIIFASMQSNSTAQVTATPGEVAATDIWTAARNNDTDRITQLIQEGADLDAKDSKLAINPLAHAALWNSIEAAQALIAGGADVNLINGDGSTAAHSALFFGRVEIAKLLIQNNADLSITNNFNSTPAQAMLADAGTTQYFAKMINLDVDQAKVDAGRKEITAFLADPSNLTAEQSTAKAAQDSAALTPLSGLYAALTQFPFFHHLWFLWFLCWLVGGFAIYACAADAFGWQGLPNWLILSPVRFVWLIPLTFAAQSFMSGVSFGPDTSSGLLPIAHVLVYYAVFFGFGVLYFDAGDRTGQVGNAWWLSLPVALLVVFPLGYEFQTGEFGFGDKLLAAEHHPAATNLLQVAYAWLMAFGFMGLFRQFFANENKTTRYISDSSYWLYVVHLPLIILVQMVTSEWQLPLVVKIVLVPAVVSGALLLTYHWFVRYTPIGSLLNGKRTRPTRQEPSELATEPR